MSPTVYIVLSQNISEHSLSTTKKKKKERKKKYI